MFPSTPALSSPWPVKFLKLQIGPTKSLNIVRFFAIEPELQLESRQEAGADQDAEEEDAPRYTSLWFLGSLAGGDLVEKGRQNR